MSNQQRRKGKLRIDLPSAEKVQEELSKAENMDDFFGKEGIFAKTLEQMLEAELSDHLGYEPYEACGRHSGNSRNEHDSKKVRSCDGDVEIQVPRDREGSFEPHIVPKYAPTSAYPLAFPGAFASWAISPVWTCGWLPAPPLESINRVTLFRTFISRDVRTVLYAGSRCE